MTRIRAAAGLVASVALLAATAGPVAAEPLPPTLSIETSVAQYLGGWWEESVSFNVTCEGYATQEIWVGLPGSTGDILPQLGPAPAGASCFLEVGYYPDPGEGAGWESQEVTPGDHFVLGPGDNVVSVTFQRAWAGDWPPGDDTTSEHDMALVVDRVYLNGKGGIEVEGTSWCDASSILTGDFEGDLYANAQWTAWQYVGRKTTLAASYDSAIAHPCWVGSEPGHGPYRWQTRYPYPDGSLQWIYSLNGKFGSGTIHVEARAQSETVLVTQSFAPDGWSPFEGLYVPYDPDAPDGNGDGWSVDHHYWFGWDQADLKPVRMR
jgi:hypothetical protein